MTDNQPSVRPPTREQIAQALSAVIYDRGDRVPDWPADEAAVYREWRDDHSISEAHRRVEALIIRKAADAVLALFPQPTPSAEPTVQVPVSLIERLKWHMEHEQLELLDEAVEEVVALLSQPTPSAEADEPWDRADVERVIVSTRPLDDRDDDTGLPDLTPPAEPVSIADMAPGERLAYEAGRTRGMNDAMDALEVKQ